MTSYSLFEGHHRLAQGEMSALSDHLTGRMLTIAGLQTAALGVLLAIFR